MNVIWVILFLIGFSILLPSIHAETITQNMEGGVDIDITYPNEIIAGREGIISILIKNNGWEDKQDIVLMFSNQDNTISITDKSDKIDIDELAQGGSYGGSVNLLVSNNTNPGIHFVNLKYSQVLVANNETPQPPIYQDIAIPIVVKEEANVVIYTKIPESIFANAEFPIEVEIISEDIDLTDVNVKIIPPKDIEFRGETSHSFSKIERNTPIEIVSRITTPIEKIDSEYKIPFEIIVEYTNDIGEEKIDSQTVSVILRPRTFMELTLDGGIWIGGFFIAPYVSLGTIIGIPAGAIISLLIKRNQKVGKKRKKSKSLTVF